MYQSQSRCCEKKILSTDSSGRFIIGKSSVPMRLWQQIDVNGKLKYMLRPALDETAKSEENSTSLTSLPSIKIEENDLHAEPSVQRTTNEERNRFVGSFTNFCEVVVDYYSCDKCGLKFPMESMLNRHKSSHSLYYWLRRKHFNKKYISRLKVNLKRHVKESKVEKQLKKYSCTMCNFTSDKRIGLTLHVRRKHKFSEDKTDPGKFLCVICGDKCKTQERLKKHMCQHRNTSTMYFKCNKCGFECRRSSVLVSHTIQSHRKTGKSTKQCTRKKFTEAKCHYKSSQREDSKDISLQDEKKNNPVASPPPMEFECKKETQVPSRANKKQKKTSEEHCNLCDFKCTTKSTLYSHKRQHKVENISEVYSCNECGFKTSKKSSLYSHIKRKHKVTKSCTGNDQPELFYCNQCDYKNKNKYELKVHVARKHTDDFKFSCETCGKKFKVKGDLTNHIRFSHREQPVICDVCGKTCLNSNSLYVHQKFAHYKAKYECQVCKRRMVSQENLNEHMLRQHERRENVVCEECGKTFSRNSRLKVHMRIHTGDKPYTCTICNKSFARRTALKQHLLIHTGIRPYVCDICGKAFTQKPGLISHRKSHPGSHPPLPRVLIDHILNDVMNN